MCCLERLEADGSVSMSLNLRMFFDLICGLGEVLMGVTGFVSKTF